ncbi:hypothetical protein IWQ61_001517 [Dispira simplex]|nr:hypothetical protein IWQ61_001517 [Dispira simplex]
MLSIFRTLGDKHRKSPRSSGEHSDIHAPRRVRLDDILCGCTDGPVSLPNFRRFLQTREHSVENLNFYEWYIIYCTRWSILETDLQNLSPALSHYPSSQDLPHFAIAEEEMVPFPPVDPESVNPKKRGSQSSLVHESFSRTRAGSYRQSITIQSRVYLGHLCNGQLPSKRPAFLSALEAALTPDVNDFDDSDEEVSGHTSRSRPKEAPSPGKSHVSRANISGPRSYSDTNLPRGGSDKTKRRQPFRREIDHCVARFFSPLSPDELNIPQQLRQQVINDAKVSTHPAAFEPAFREIMKMLNRSVQDHFLKYAEQQLAAN